MATINLGNTTFERLQTHATPLIDSAESVILRLLDYYESKLTDPPRMDKQLGSASAEWASRTGSERGGRAADEVSIAKSPLAPLNDVYVNFGHGEDWRQWDDARQYGFICAGGGRRYSRPLFGLKPSDLLWVYVPGYGFTGVGSATGQPQRIADFMVHSSQGEPQPLSELLGDDYANDSKFPGDADRCEYFIPVRWIHTVPLEEAVRDPDDFSNPAIVCRPTSQRWRDTVDRVARAFGITPRSPTIRQIQHADGN